MYMCVCVGTRGWERPRAPSFSACVDERKREWTIILLLGLNFSIRINYYTLVFIIYIVFTLQRFSSFEYGSFAKKKLENLLELHFFLI